MTNAPEAGLQLQDSKASDPKIRHWHVVGGGFEHIVLAKSAQPTNVLKISAHRARYFIWQTRTGTQKWPRLVEIFQQEAAVRRRDLSQLRQHFSLSELPPERRWVGQLELSSEAVAHLFDGDPWGRTLADAVDPVLCWTMFACQSYVPLAHHPERLSFSFGRFPEDVLPIDSQRAAVTRAAIAGQPVCVDTFLGRQDIERNGDLGRVIHAARSDQEFRSALSHFLEKAIKYANRTGNIFALGGRDNVFFVQDRGSWRCILLDPFPIVPGPILRRSEHLVVSGEKLTEPPDQKGRELIKRAFNFIRVVNVLASWLGVGDRVRISPMMSAVTDANLSPDGSYAWPGL